MLLEEKDVLLEEEGCTIGRKRMCCWRSKDLLLEKQGYAVGGGKMYWVKIKKTYSLSLPAPQITVATSSNTYTVQQCST